MVLRRQDNYFAEAIEARPKSRADAFKFRRKTPKRTNLFAAEKIDTARIDSRNAGSINLKSPLCQGKIINKSSVLHCYNPTSVPYLP